MKAYCVFVPFLADEDSLVIMDLSHVIIFVCLHFSLQASTTYQQKRASQRVKEAMARGDTLQIEKRIYIQLPSDEDHKNVHSLGEVGF